MSEGAMTTRLEAYPPDHVVVRGVQQVLDAARARLGMQVAFISRFEADDLVFCQFSGDTGRFGVMAGDRSSVVDHLCHHVRATAAPLIVADIPSDPVHGQLAVPRAVGLGSYVGVPVLLSSGEMYGTLCCVADATHSRLTGRDVAFLEVLAQLVANQLESQRASVVAEAQQQSVIGSLIEADAISMVFQPIVDLADGSVVGYEALSRFPDGVAPDVWFARAEEVGLGTALELAAVRAALAHLAQLRGHQWMSVNLSATAMVSKALPPLLARAQPERIVLELTEHEQVSDYGALLATTSRLRELGCRIAIDDAGSGFASFNRILQLDPDLLKLDRCLIRAIDVDPVRRALAVSLVSLGESLDATLIAEGVETAEEVDTLRLLGVSHAQGYHFARPAPLPQHPEGAGGVLEGSTGRPDAGRPGPPAP